jgi:hypothetical protein
VTAPGLSRYKSASELFIQRKDARTGEPRAQNRVRHHALFCVLKRCIVGGRWTESMILQMQILDYNRRLQLLIAGSRRAICVVTESVV